MVMKKRPEISIADGDRCRRRSDGKNGRCRLPRVGGSFRCEKHGPTNLQRYGENRSSATVGVGVRVSHTSVIGKGEEFDADVRVSDLHEGGARVSDFSDIENKYTTLVSVPGATAIGEEENEEGDGGDVRLLKSGDIWAFAGESDGFPRSYARIDGIIPIFPVGYLAQATTLVPHPISDEDRWFSEQGVSLACGTFEASDSALVMDISSFSHKVLFEMEGKDGSLYRIFPRKGEVWAVYFKWNDLKESFEYKLVEVVSEFSDEDEVTVFGLVQVEDKGWVYRRHVVDGFYQVRSFSRSHMSMFSHQVWATRVQKGGEVFWKVIVH